MKYAREFVTSTVVGGLFIVVPVYLAVVLLLKGMKSVGGLVRPIAVLIPDWLPAERLLSLAWCWRCVSSSGWPLDIPFTQAIRSVSRWGAGSKDLVAAMRKGVAGLADRRAVERTL